ncbi:TICN2 protein, partial [Polypterus senegalus]
MVGIGNLGYLLVPLLVLAGSSKQGDVKSVKDTENAGSFMEDEQWLSTISQYSRKIKHWNRFRDVSPQRLLLLYMNVRGLSWAVIKKKCNPIVCHSACPPRDASISIDSESPGYIDWEKVPCMLSEILQVIMKKRVKRQIAGQPASRCLRSLSNPLTRTEFPDFIRNVALITVKRCANSKCFSKNKRIKQ